MYLCHFRTHRGFARHPLVGWKSMRRNVQGLLHLVDSKLDILKILTRSGGLWPPPILDGECFVLSLGTGP